MKLFLYLTQIKKKDINDTQKALPQSTKKHMETSKTLIQYLFPFAIPTLNLLDNWIGEGQQRKSRITSKAFLPLPGSSSTFCTFLIAFAYCV